MYLGVIVDKGDEVDHEIELLRIVPKASNLSIINHYIQSMILFIKDTIKGEIHFFQQVQQAQEQENYLRMYCKQMRYLSTYYIYLYLHSIQSQFPLPLQLTDFITSDIKERKKLIIQFPDLFSCDKGRDCFKGLFML